MQKKIKITKSLIKNPRIIENNKYFTDSFVFFNKEHFETPLYRDTENIKNKNIEDLFVDINKLEKLYLYELEEVKYLYKENAIKNDKIKLNFDYFKFLIKNNNNFHIYYKDIKTPIFLVNSDNLIIGGIMQMRT